MVAEPVPVAAVVVAVAAAVGKSSVCSFPLRHWERLTPWSGAWVDPGVGVVAPPTEPTALTAMHQRSHLAACPCLLGVVAPEMAAAQSPRRPVLVVLVQLLV